MILMVPVGAMVVVVEFRSLGPSSYIEPLKDGNSPRVLARFCEAAFDSSCMNFITFSAFSTGENQRRLILLDKIGYHLTGVLVIKDRT